MKDQEIKRIIDRETGAVLAQGFRREKMTVVFTNGCFDMLHLGHIHLLKNAKAQGDVLFVGINTDASVSRLKGPDRPVQNLKTRLGLVAAVRYVDYVIPFDQDTPYQLIELIRPHIIVKGGDYRPDQVVGADLVDRVVIVPLLEGYSTTSLIRRLKRLSE